MQSDRDLQRELRELGSELEYPPTPDLARTVRDRLDAEAAPRRSWLSTPALRWAAVAAVVLLAAVPILSPALRDAAAGWFSEGGQAGGADQAAGGAAGGAAETSQPDTQNAAPASATGEETMMMEDGQASRAGGADMPSSGGGDLPSSGVPSSEGDLGYGQRITLREAESRLAGKEPLLPALGEPDRVYAGGPSRNDGVVLVYRPGQGLPSLGDTGVGLVLTEVPGSVESAYLRGGTLAVSGVEEVSVGSERGYWVPDGSGLRSPAGRGGDLPGNVLFWEREGLALRLGADLSKREAIQLAESVR